MSVYSLKLTLVSSLPLILARFSTRLVLPTPGGPSIKVGFDSWKARSSRWRFDFVVFASNANCDVDLAAFLSNMNGLTPISISVFTNSPSYLFE